jgi:hypothetical protein
VDRQFACVWPGCNKAYGFLHHLNTHIRNAKHGPEQKSTIKRPRKRHSEPQPARYRTSLSLYLIMLDDSPPRRSTFTPQRITISSDTEPSPQSPRSKRLPSIEQKPNPRPDYHLDIPPQSPRSKRLPSIEQQPTPRRDYHLGIPPLTTVTLVYQRRPPLKPRGLHIPFWGRRRSPTKKISLDRLWETHYRLERLRKAGLPTTVLKYPETSGRGRGSGFGRGRGGRRGVSSGGTGGGLSIVDGGDVNNLKVRGVVRRGRPPYKHLMNRVMVQQRSRSPEL